MRAVRTKTPATATHISNPPNYPRARAREWRGDMTSFWLTAAAVLLALLGIYSVIAFSTALRTQEMAIRLALGSQRSGVMRLVLVSGAKLGLAGCAIGGIAGVFATGLLRSLLFQVDPLDPMVLGLAVVSILAIALAASVIPARRAALLDPMEALRAE